MKVRSWRAPEIQAAGVLALLTVAARLWSTRALSFCGTPDACFYLGMAQNLAAGRGFHARFLYDLQQRNPSLPNTGLEYWRPGVSLLLALLRPLGGATLHGSIAITTLVGVLFAAAAWHIAIHTYNNRRIALGAFAFCLLGSTSWVGSLSPDSGLYYGAAVAWFLALCTVRRQGLWQDLTGIACIAAAYLIRNDAALLLLPLLAVLWKRRSTVPSTGSSQATSRAYTAMLLLGFVLALVPMHLLYHAVLHTTFPPGTAKVLFLNDLSDFERYNAPANLHTLWAHGVKHLLFFRVETLVTVLYRLAYKTIGYTALVFLPGLFVRVPVSQSAGTTTSPATGLVASQTPLAKPGKEAPELVLPEFTGPATLFVATLLIYTLMLPAVGGFAALRTASALVPLVAVLVMVAVLRVARTPRLAAALPTSLLVATGLDGFMEAHRLQEEMNANAASDRAIAARLLACGATTRDSVVLTSNPVQFAVTTGFATVALPNNGANAVAEAARHFHANYILLDTEHPSAMLDELDHALHPAHAILVPHEHTEILALPGQLPCEALVVP